MLSRSRIRTFLTDISGDNGSVSQKRAAAWDTMRKGRGLGRTLTNKHVAKWRHFALLATITSLPLLFSLISLKMWEILMYYSFYIAVRIYK